jgi:hypothetical protein
MRRLGHVGWDASVGTRRVERVGWDASAKADLALAERQETRPAHLGRVGLRGARASVGPRPLESVSWCASVGPRLLGVRVD